MNNTYTLITGASKGIGLELTYLFAKDQHNLILVARSSDLLEQIKLELESLYNIKVVVLAMDLTKEDVAKEIYQYTKDNNLIVDYLVNNAGFGDYGNFIETSPKKNKDMVQLNIVTLTELCQLYGKDMVCNKFGKIMNVASIASFLPGPLMATYYATKSYVLSFSEALSREFKNTGVSVTALCPGTTKTNFFEVAKADKDSSNLLKNLKPADPKDVARYGYKKMKKNKAVAIYGFTNRLMIFGIRLVPRSLVRNIAYKIQSKRKA